MSTVRTARRRTSPRPFLKWAGGKGQLLASIIPELPEAPIELYVEPFLGGGAVFLELARLGRVRRAVLGDRNPELVDTWRAVQADPEPLLVAFDAWAPDAETYYRVRGLDPKTLGAVERAARVLYLNRHGFNGLYRLNSSGGFNVPFGQYAKPPRIDPENLRAVHRALQGVTLVEGDFETVLGHATPGSTVYCDPPYWPVSETSSFACYDGSVFRRAEQERLAASFRVLAARGVFGLLSNSDVPETRALYAGLPQRTVWCRRSINSRSDRRGAVAELLVRTVP
jgi:DNA adenine methylase